MGMVNNRFKKIYLKTYVLVAKMYEMLNLLCLLFKKTKNVWTIFGKNLKNI